MVTTLPHLHGHDLHLQTEEERKQALAEQYAQMFGIPELRHPIAYVEKNWDEEEWSGGCYVGVMPPHVLTNWGRGLREPWGCVHFAGTETASKWIGYMDGAIEAGERAACEVLVRLTEDGTIVDPILPLPEEPPNKEVVPRRNDQDMFPWLPGVGWFACALLIVVISIGMAVFLSW